MNKRLYGKRNKWSWQEAVVSEGVLNPQLEAEKNARTGSSYLREQIYVVANSLPLLGVPL